MRKKLFSSLQYIVFLGLGIFLVWWQLKGLKPADQENFLDSLRNANYWLIPVIVVIVLISHISRCLRWRILLEPLGYKPRLSNMFCATMLGYLANSAVPRLGEVLKCTILAKYEKIPADKLIGTIVAERIFDLVCFIIVIGITLLSEWTAIVDFTRNDLSKMGGGFNFTKLYIIVGTFILIVLILAFLFKKYKQNKTIQKIHGFASGIKAGLSTIKTLKQRKSFIFHTFLIWFMYLLQVYVGFSAMAQVSHLGFGAAFAVLVAATFAMIATPGGIGTFPIAIMLILALFKIPDVYGKSFGWLMWGVSTSIIIIVGFICLLVLPTINKNNIETT